MFILKNRRSQKYLKTQAKQGFSLGFVPTMGALRRRISLIKRQKAMEVLL